MTPKGRKKHLKVLKETLRDEGYREDSWGNFKPPNSDNYRFKFKKVNLRIEWKIVRTGEWSKMTSFVWSRTTPERIKELADHINKRTKEV